jgi:hypothetical protein
VKDFFLSPRKGQFKMIEYLLKFHTVIQILEIFFLGVKFLFCHTHQSELNYYRFRYNFTLIYIAFFLVFFNRLDEIFCFVAFKMDIFSLFLLFVCMMVFNDTLNNISVISWQSVLLVEDTLCNKM